jgi:hypothetical protein
MAASLVGLVDSVEWISALSLHNAVRSCAKLRPMC